MIKKNIMINNDLVTLDSDYYLYLLNQDETLNKIHKRLIIYKNDNSLISADELLYKFFNSNEFDLKNTIIKNSKLEEMLKEKGRNYVLTMYINRYIHMTQKQLDHVLNYDRRSI